MAQYRWFKIGEANAEIERLEGLLAATNEKLQSASNDSEIANEAQRLKAEIDSLKHQISAKEATISVLTKERDDARAEAAKAKADAEAHCQDFDEKVKAAASKQALNITAAQGQPPVSQTPANTPAGTENKVELTGLERVKAAFRAQINK